MKRVIKTFSFVIAAPWPLSPDSLCVYSWGSEVHTGSKEQAIVLRDRVRAAEAPRDKEVSSSPKSDTYDIYVLTKFEEEK
jgi:hypothetical protein